MSDLEAKAPVQVSLSATSECSMTAAEALAIAWTGIEELARMKLANLYRSPLTGRVFIVLIDAEYSDANGLVPLVKKEEVSPS